MSSRHFDDRFLNIFSKVKFEDRVIFNYFFRKKVYVIMFKPKHI